MKNYKKIKAMLIALTMSLAMMSSISASATNNLQSGKELSYVLNVLPRYLDANELSGSDVWISEPYTLTNTATDETVGNAYLVFDADDYVGFVDVTEVDSTFYSSFVKDDFNELQFAFDSETPVALYYDDETFCISIESDGPVSLSTTTRSTSDVTYQPIERAARLKPVEMQQSRSVLYDSTLAVTPVANAVINGYGICWLSTLTAKYNYYNDTDFTGPEMYELIDDTYYSTYHEHPYGTWPWITRTADFLEVGSNVDDPMNYTSVYSKIHSNTPIYCGVTRTGGAHAVLLCGMKIYSNGTGVYKFADPNFTNYVTTDVSSSAMSDGSQLVYVGSYTYNWTSTMY